MNNYKKKFTFTSRACKENRKTNENTIVKRISDFILKCVVRENPNYFKDTRKCVFVYGGRGYVDNFKIIPKDKISDTIEKSTKANFLWSLIEWVTEACDYVDTQFSFAQCDGYKFKPGKLSKIVEVKVALATEIDNSLVVSFDYDVDNEEEHPAGYTLTVVFEKRKRK